jgi:hypothetical protein
VALSKMAMKTRSKFYPAFFLCGLFFPVVAASFLADDYFMFRNPSTSILPYVLLAVGLAMAAEGHRLMVGSWGAVTRVLRERLAYASLVFLFAAGYHVLMGGSIRTVSAALLTAISGFLVASWLPLRTAKNRRRGKLRSQPNGSGRASGARPADNHGR